MEAMRRLQVGIVGSAAVDASTRLDGLTLAAELGAEIARAGHLLFFGYEGDCDSISQCAARSCEAHGGSCVGFLWGAQREIEGYRALWIATGMARGGGRESVFVRSCDALIAVGGGSGTLTEICIAYQAGVPVIALRDTGGWSDRLAGQYLDARRRLQVQVAVDAPDALRLVAESTRRRVEA